MDFVQEHLKKKEISFEDSQELSNNIELEILADTIYVKVRSKKNYNTIQCNAMKCNAIKQKNRIE